MLGHLDNLTLDIVGSVGRPSRGLRSCLAIRVSSRIELVLTNSCQIIKNLLELASTYDFEIRSLTLSKSPLKSPLLKSC